MVRKYFGTDGIRGRANATITPELALKVGQAAGLLFLRGEHRHRVVIGKDTRLSGYMISASHNPYDDNGIKLFGPDGYKLSDEAEREIERLIDADISKRLAKGAHLGRAKRIDGVHD